MRPGSKILDDSGIPQGKFLFLRGVARVMLIKERVGARFGDTNELVHFKYPENELA